MAAQQRTLLEFSPPPPGTVVINDRVSIRTEGSHRAVFVHGLVLMHYDIMDHAAEECAMVTLFEAGYADQNDIARAFGYTTRSLRRFQERIQSGGLLALGKPRELRHPDLPQGAFPQNLREEIRPPERPITKADTWSICCMIMRSGS